MAVHLITLSGGVESVLAGMEWFLLVLNSHCPTINVVVVVEVTQHTATFRQSYEWRHGPGMYKVFLAAGLRSEEINNHHRPVHDQHLVQSPEAFGLALEFLFKCS